ncbi:lysophospholipid acyltransferase family protein [Deinococcus peraridilitoris]|uniref:1-acyl-sn-glycerol-3-phosphate acyltransferase n=1 Tax=Deinococcus peraridilitoris (strain DSM 19664 / LMG 22246 / CIP 109416 / KR-200) TaxID=937777 RepID=L0A3Q6_DEIPD|nr:1-acyl-sn-glycerol-3-phosphate acyltransferase [Deinococcus peraridilitoris]AFZ68069.1 1-acyl-sn-glycerol-3-phosphate acyltransferase [Deinococcus peraridilitoris DSM 19664]
MDLVESSFRTLIRRTVRRDLRGVWLRGALPPGGAVLALNHHSWWDGYVLAEVCWTFGRRPSVLMNDEQLARFAFFRALGVLGTRELRPAVRRARAGEWLWIFPEGRLTPGPAVVELQPGAAWLARAAGVPLVPVALRVVLRGHQHPEAYLRIGTPTADLTRGLASELSLLDQELTGSDPEWPLAGYLQLTRGARDVPERLEGPSRTLTRLLGHPKKRQGGWRT